jgi:hypothetical protein
MQTVHYYAQVGTELELLSEVEFANRALGTSIIGTELSSCQKSRIILFNHQVVSTPNSFTTKSFAKASPSYLHTSSPP